VGQMPNRENHARYGTFQFTEKSSGSMPGFKFHVQDQHAQAILLFGNIEISSPLAYIEHVFEFET
jgi:hypothetical protein